MATTTEPIRKILVGGEWYETGETIEVTSPFDGSVVAQVAFGGRADAERAVDAAAKAMEEPIPAHERAAVLDRVAALRRDLALQLPAQPRRAQGGPGVRGRLRMRAQARNGDAAVGAPPRAGLRRRGSARRLAQRRRRQVERDRRR